MLAPFLNSRKSCAETKSRVKVLLSGKMRFGADIAIVMFIVTNTLSGMSDVRYRKESSDPGLGNWALRLGCLMGKLLRGCTRRGCTRRGFIGNILSAWRRTSRHAFIENERTQHRVLTPTASRIAAFFPSNDMRLLALRRVTI